MSFYKARLVVSGAILMMGLVTCVSPEPPPAMEIPLKPRYQSPVPVPSKDPQPLSDSQKLTALAPVGSKKALLVQDVIALLRAREAAAMGDLPTAQAHWKEAVLHAKGSFASISFEHWVKSHAQQQDGAVDAQLLAKLLLAETQEGQASWFIRQRQLADVDRLADHLYKVIPDQLSPRTEFSLAAASAPEMKSKDMSLSPDLKTWNKRGKRYCRKTSSEQKIWDELALQLAPDLQAFWFAKKMICQGHLKKSIQFFDRIKQQSKYRAAVKVYASRSIVGVMKSLDRRKDAADEYVNLIKIWARIKKIDADLYGATALDVALEQVNDHLWAARYRALMGFYDQAEGYCHRAVKILNGLQIGGKNVSGKQRTRFNEYRAEVYHTLASRIAVEKREFDAAISYGTLGLELQDNSDQWRQRFLWYLGLYSYLGGNFYASKRYWEDLLGALEQNSSRAQVYFWLARAHSKLQQADEADFYFKALLDEFPVSFYTLAAVKQLKSIEAGQWRKLFDGRLKNASANVNHERFKLANLRKHETAGPLLLRAEILLAAKIDQSLARVAVREASRYIQKTFRVHEESIPAFVYLTRLQFAVNDHLASISLTSELAKLDSDFWQHWPDQLYVYYPAPHLALYKEKAKVFEVSTAELLAISRQETSFRADAISGAGAIGLMQFIMPTATKYAQRLGLDTLALEEKLKDPEFNITLGAAYMQSLGKYYDDFQPAIYGAYNAGEFAVDQWIKSRQHTDPLVWVELVPYGETKNYVKRVWRNALVYEFLMSESEKWSINSSINPKFAIQ